MRYHNSLPLDYPLLAQISFPNLGFPSPLKYRKNRNERTLCPDIGVASLGKALCFLSSCLSRKCVFLPFPEGEILDYLAPPVTQREARSGARREPPLNLYRTGIICAGILAIRWARVAVE